MAKLICYRMFVKWCHWQQYNICKTKCEAYEQLSVLELLRLLPIIWKVQLGVYVLWK